MNQRPTAAHYPRIRLKSGHHGRYKSGHPWIYSNELSDWPEHLEPGAIAELVDVDGHPLATGYANRHSLIAFRLLARRPVTIGPEWVLDRLQEALRYRRSLYGDRAWYRLIHSESDGLPGIVVDHYGQVLVVSSGTAGGDRLLPWIVEGLQKLLSPHAIFEKSDGVFRELEGLQPRVQRLMGDCEIPVVVSDGRLTWEIDPLEGQKTGHFLDQESNRERVAGLCRDRSILDLFCYTGAWSIHAARAGAASVLGVDASQSAVETARRNAERNGFEKVCRFQCADVFERLPWMEEQRERFGIVVVDPPAFAKTRKDTRAALKGYRELNRRAIRLVEGEGFLVTCSCSHHVSRDEFLDVVRQAGRDLGRRMRWVEIRGAGPDHPIHPACPETEYLTCAIAYLA